MSAEPWWVTEHLAQASLPCYAGLGPDRKPCVLPGHDHGIDDSDAAVLERARRMHTPGGGGEYCPEDGFLHPCRTLRVLRAEIEP